MSIDSERLRLEELKKAAQDFAVVKSEMGGPDSVQFINVIRIFQKYGYSPSKIMEAFAEVIEIRESTFRLVNIYYYFCQYPPTRRNKSVSDAVQSSGEGFNIRALCSPMYQQASIPQSPGSGLYY